jgi:large subunit ribosomal protein L9
MKVILIKDVPKLGSAGSVQTVSNGYARNFLIPQGLAAAATAGTIKQVEERTAAEGRRIAKQEEAMRGLADRISGMRIDIAARVGEQGRLYGSVTSADVADELSKLVGEEIDRRKVELEHPIHTVGDHEVTVRLVGRLTPTVVVHVFDPDAPVVEAATEASDEAGATDDSEQFGEIDESEAVDEDE